MNNFDFENPYKNSSWAKAEEFRNTGKQIKPLKWEILREGEGTPKASFVNNKGYTYRLTFEEGVGIIRFYENRWDSFSVSMKSNGIKPEVWGILTNYKDTNGRWQWKWKLLSSQNESN